MSSYSYHSSTPPSLPNAAALIIEISDDNTTSSSSSSSSSAPPPPPTPLHDQLLPSHPSPSPTQSPPLSASFRFPPHASQHHQKNPSKRPRSPTPPAPDDFNVCPICLEPWTSSGEHHLVCLPCGHLFGLNCIRVWLQNKRKPSCPTCKHAARIRDIRYLFGVPARLQVADTSEMEQLRQELEVEKGRHAMARERLRRMEQLAEGLRREVEGLRKGVREFGSGGGAGCNKGGVVEVGRCATNGGSAAVGFDGRGGLLFGEFVRNGWGSKQRVGRLDIGRGVVAERSRVWTLKRVNGLAVCERGGDGMFGNVAVAAGEGKLRVLTRDLQLAGDVEIGGMPVSVMWMKEKGFVVCGTERGEVVTVDVRMLRGGVLFRSVVGERGAKAVHSLGEVGGVVVAGTVGGVYGVCYDRAGVSVEELMSMESHGFVCGIGVGGSIVGVGSRKVGDEGKKGRIVVHDGVKEVGERMELGEVRGILEGHTQTLPFGTPGVVGGSTGEGMFICAGDGGVEGGVRVWEGKGVRGFGEGTVVGGGRGVVRCGVGMRLPREARLGSVECGTQALFGCVGDECVRLFAAGAY